MAYAWFGHSVPTVRDWLVHRPFLQPASFSVLDVYEHRFSRMMQGALNRSLRFRLRQRFRTSLNHCSIVTSLAVGAPVSELLSWYKLLGEFQPHRRRRPVPTRDHVLGDGSIKRASALAEPERVADRRGKHLVRRHGYHRPDIAAPTELQAIALIRNPESREAGVMHDGGGPHGRLVVFLDCAASQHEWN